MNYSYVMGIDNIEKLKENDFQIKSYENHYEIIFTDDKIGMYEKFIYENLQNIILNL